MCGIAGQISADPNKIAANYPAYCRMQKSLARRGPDQRGMYLHGHAALIHARLAVVDLENGCQPMVLDQGGEKYILVYNGELYNTPELHAQLAALGHRFVSHSDTEVLLHAFAQWGPDCLEKLNGIFAFAVWQQRAQKLFLARDRIGVKPLFYALRGDSLIFASELKTLLCHPEIPPQVDAHGLADVLLLGPGRTPGCGVFRNVQELKPGCCAEYTVPQVGAPRLTVRRYWQLTDHEHPDDFTHTAAKVRDLVMDAVTRQLVSDVPVATFLSGGLDSSLVCAIAARKSKTPIRTFAIGMSGDAIDLKYAKQVADYIGSEHTEVIMTKEQVLDSLENVIHLLGTFDITTIRASMGMYLLCKWIHENTDIRVLLTGEISDELFGYKYTDFAPSAEEFQKESEKRIRELHMYDVLRADRCISSNSLEARVPFGDLDFVKYVLSVDPEKKLNTYGIGKYLLRRAFEGDYLPPDILYREKAAFSDAVGHSMVDYLKEYAEKQYTDEEFEQKMQNYTHAAPFTKESLLYREIFEKYYPGQGDMIVDFWMPNKEWEGCNVNDPSARVLSNYGASGK